MKKINEKKNEKKHGKRTLKRKYWETTENLVDLEAFFLFQRYCNEEQPQKNCMSNASIEVFLNHLFFGYKNNKSWKHLSSTGDNKTWGASIFCIYY